MCKIEKYYIPVLLKVVIISAVLCCFFNSGAAKLANAFDTKH